MIKVSGGYTYINPNFVISDIPKGEEIDFEVAGILAILKNILLRGVPTLPSAFLQENIHGVFETKAESKGVQLLAEGDGNLEWGSTIKGWVLKKPALAFYEALKKTFPKEWRTFLPECPLYEIGASVDALKENNKAVDFYSPFYRLAIEIDGPQHEDSDQKEKDAIRDQWIKEHTGSEPLRIKSTDLSDPLKMEQHWRSIKRNLLKREGVEFLSQNDVLRVTQIQQYMYVFRLQILLLELFQSGYWSFDDVKETVSVRVQGDAEIAKGAFKLAYQDLQLWIENLYELRNKKISFPEIDFSDEAELVVDIDLFNRYDENLESERNIIKIRNDYFPYERRAYCNPLTLYSGGKNYYRVATSDIRFDDLNDKHKDALQFFLKNIFGHDKFKPKQLEIITRGLNPNNGVIGLLPTGSGKSVCYQLISMLTPGITLVIAPLTLLIQDQVDNLNARNKISNAIGIYGGHKAETALFEKRQSKLLYVSPERFFSPEFSEIAQKTNIAQVVIDEVHCLSEWGHDFRTSYLLLLNFLQKSAVTPKTLLMGTSATASPRVINDIRGEFSKLKSLVLVESATSIKRDELTFDVVKVEDERARDDQIRSQVEEYVQRKEKTLVFGTYIKDVQKLKEMISGIDGCKVEAYYGGGDENDNEDIDKARAFKRFKEGTIMTLAATKAFGMGVDVPDIRHTIHYNVASSVEALYQEMGRAGRDGKASHCTVLFLNNSTINNINTLFSNAFSITTLHELRKKDAYFDQYGEIRKQLLFLASSNSEYSETAKFVVGGVWEFIRRLDANAIFGLKEAEAFLKEKGVVNRDHYKKNGELRSGVFKTAVDKALYRLYVLGLIDLWGMEYTDDINNPLYTGVVAQKKALSDVQQNLEAHIRRYDFSYTYRKIGNTIDLEDYVRAFCKWEEENFLHYRWESLKTLFDMLSNFEDSDKFVQRVENFFMRADSLNEAIASPHFKKWFEVLFEIDATILKDNLAAYRAEYRNNNCVDFIGAMLSFKLEHALNKAHYKNLCRVMKEQLQLSDGDKKVFFEGIVAYLGADPLAVDAFLEFLADEFPKELKRSAIRSLVKKMPEATAEALKDRLSYNSIFESLMKLKKELND